MKLTPDQLETIRDYIAKRGFKYYEVQMEILDHVATSVEEKITADPALNFNTALEQCHRDFGIMGFSSISDAVSDGLEQKYNHLLWAGFRSVFGLKYIVLLMLFAYGLFKLFEMLGDDLDRALFFFMIISHLTEPYITKFFTNKPVLNPKYKHYLSYIIPIGYTHYFIIFYSLAILVKTFTPASSMIIGLNTQLVLLTCIFTLFLPYVYAVSMVVKRSRKEIELLDICDT
jgi:hypothetical protein